jgi:hypothetical protein
MDEEARRSAAETSGVASSVGRTWIGTSLELMSLIANGSHCRSAERVDWERIIPAARSFRVRREHAREGERQTDRRRCPN